MREPTDRAGLSELLTKRGFVAATEEARELLACAGGDRERLQVLVARRLTGEPLAWITGTVCFCGVEVRVDPGVYVPRWHTEELVRRAIECLPPEGIAVDLCTGSGAIAKVMSIERPRARVVACDVDGRAVACAASNGVEAYRGDLFEALPSSLEGCVDVVIAVVPYVPTSELGLLQRDTFAFESKLPYDGGRDGTTVLRRVVTDARRFLRRGGMLLLELGADQVPLLEDALAGAEYGDLHVLRDEERDIRGLEAQLGP